MANLSMTSSRSNSSRKGLRDGGGGGGHDDPGEAALRALSRGGASARMWVILAVVAVVIVILALALHSRNNNRRAEAAKLLGRAMETYQAPLAVGAAAPPQAQDDSPDVGDDIPRFATAQARGEAVLAELGKLEHTPLVSTARFFSGRVLLDLGKVDEAADVYGKYLEQAKDGDELRALAREGRGYAFEAAGKYDQALEEFRKLEKESATAADRARFHQARMIERKGDKKGAETILQALADKNLRPPLSEEVGARLASLRSSATPQNGIGGAADSAGATPPVAAPEAKPAPQSDAKPTPKKAE